MNAPRRQRLSPEVALDPVRLQSDTERWIARSLAAWDARADRWNTHAEATARSADREADLARVWDALGLKPGSRVLDAGCGSGQFALAFASRGAKVTGVDLSPAMIAHSRAHAAECNVCVEWRIGDIAHLSDPFAVYDAIHARVVLQFVPDIPAVLREFRRVLKPGGRLLASVPGALSPIYQASWMRHLPGGDPGNNYLLPWELENLLREHGWRVITGWGEWGYDLYGARNEASAAGPGLERSLQQATATTWTTIAA